MMKNNATEHPRRWRRRAIGALGALVIAGSALALTAAAAAAADPHCNYPYGSNTCLTLEDQGGGIYNTRVGIDIRMSQEEAQYLIDVNGGAPFGVEVLAHDHDDPADDTSGLFEIGDEPDDLYQVSAGANGLSGNFEEKVSCLIFNEDNDGPDEVVARVTLYDPNYPGGVVQFHSGIIVRNFENCLSGGGGGGGGGGCPFGNCEEN
jgi:hypothetical protein